MRVILVKVHLSSLLKAFKSYNCESEMSSLLNPINSAVAFINMHCQPFIYITKTSTEGGKVWGMRKYSSHFPRSADAIASTFTRRNSVSTVQEQYTLLVRKPNWISPSIFSHQEPTIVIGWTRPSSLYQLNNDPSQNETPF